MWHAVSLQVYPNPTTVILNLIQEIADQARNNVRSIEIFDVYGRNVFSHKSIMSPETTIDISYFSAGIYFVKVITEQGEVMKKVVKQ